MPGVDLHQFMVDLRDFVVNWWPLLGLTFYCVLLYIFWRMLQLMPRVKPATVIVDPRTAIDWNDIAGADEAKMELAEIVEFLRDPKRFEQLGAVVPKGVLLYGPPGTGKTLLARATATESGAKFYAQSASAFVEMFAGLGAARIRKLFAEARKNAPSIIFIDELDAVGAARTGSSFNREQDQTLNQLLVELDGFASGDQVVVVGASNRLQDLDPALLRPGRFDRQLLVAPPDRVGREAILHVHTRTKPLSADVQLDLIARQTSGLTGADLANIANEAAILAGRREAKYVGAADFDNALERIVAGLQQKKVLTDKERRILAYHEAGHALMSHLMGEVGHLQKVTIVSRGNALGYTLHLPNEDRYMESKEELIDMLKIALAGRAAEQVVFGRVTNGAASDLERATEIARAMVFEWGMSDVVTSRTLRADNYALSEETKRVRDNEQARLTDDAYAEAVRLIEKHRSSLDRLSQALLEKETLMREEVLLLLTDVEAESRASETVGTPRVVVPLSNEA
jgi:cell division protease FtsH